MKIKWNTPGGNAPGVILDMLKQPHLLIAGATGSGKSVLINSLLYTALYHSPAAVRLILIDPKRVELIDYKTLPHVIRYASEPEEIATALCYAVQLMESRFKAMQGARLKEYDGEHVYVIIDEFADLMTTQKRATMPLLIRLAQLGCAARVHLIAATQRPTRDIINGSIKVNMDSRVPLRCPTAQDSRNIINIKGAETLPRYGYGYYLTPETMQPQLINIPLTPAEDITERVQWYEKQVTIMDKFIRKTPV
jgi:S-DNA-T family DNA segregation ATPase FtsK/SpoIIIE